MSIAIYFGRVIKQLREERRYSQEVLADRASLNRTYLGEVERGVAVPSLATINKIANALNLTASELLARSERQEKIDEAIKEKPLLQTVV